LCGAVELKTDAIYKLALTDAATTYTMTLKTGGEAKLVPPATHTYMANANQIPMKVGRSTKEANTWKLAQAHFHWGRDGHQDEGSEHYIEGVQYPLEVHFVHVNSIYADLTAALASGNSDALMVVGQFFKVPPHPLPPLPLFLLYFLVDIHVVYAYTHVHSRTKSADES